MMETEAKQLLEETFNRIQPGESYRKARKSYEKLKIYTDTRCVTTERNLYPMAWEQMKQSGGLTAALISNEKNRMVLVVASGAKQRNPAVVELLFTENSLTVTAWAKEGLIKQRTAQGAVATCLEALHL